MFELISKSYSMLEAEQYRGYRLSNDDEALVRDAAKEILERMPHMPNCCAPMSAVWAAMIRCRTKIPVHVVAGNLNFNEVRIYGDDSPFSSLAELFNLSDLTWDGHCWVDFAGVIGEISFFRSADSDSSLAWIKQAAPSLFMDGCEMRLDTPERLKISGFIYEPRYVLTDVQLTGLCRCAWNLIENKKFPS